MAIPTRMNHRITGTAGGNGVWTGGNGSLDGRLSDSGTHLHVISGDSDSGHNINPDPVFTPTRSHPMSHLTVDITDLGGIDSLEATVPAGITVLSGENATNRTSFLRAVAAALGGDESAAQLKSDADDGSVTIEGDGIDGTRTYSRSPNDDVVRGGDPVTDDPELVDTYVSIFADNPARRAVRNGGEGLRDLLMRGVDTAAINARIHRLKHRRSAIEEQLSEVEAAKSRLPSLEERREQLADELESIEDEIESVEAEIESIDDPGPEDDEAERRLERLEGLREQVRRTRSEIEVTESTIAEAESEKERLESELSALDVPDADRQQLQDRRRRLQDEIARHKQAITDLNDVISHTDSLLEGDGALDAFNVEREEPTAALDPQSSSVRCWTCGTVVQRATIEDRIETLTELRNEKNGDLQSLERELESVESDLESIESERTKRERLEADLEETVATLESERETLSSLQDDLEMLRDEVETAQAAVEAANDEADSPLADQYQRLSRLNHERGQVETQLSSVERELEDVRSTVGEEADLREELAGIRGDLEEARNRIDSIERQVVDEFTSQMDDLLDLLDYDNISRVWIERVETEGGSSSFDLHVVRETAAGAVYEDEISTLSESEREIIGIVVALSGYFVHELSDTIPVVLFDSVEAIDATRLETLFEYVHEYVPTIVAALLPEEADAIEHHTLSEPFVRGTA